MIHSLSAFHFIRPQWLLLALPALAFWWGWRRSTDPLRGWRDQINFDLLNALVVNHTGAARLRNVGMLVAWLLAVLIVAGPTWKPEPSPFAEDASPLMIVLKADESMETSDIEPSRLERAHLKIADLAQARKGQPLGLIAYAGSAHLVLPPTKDTGVVAQMAEEISPGVMPAPGDRLDLALARAGDLLAKQDTPGSILVVADASSGNNDALAEANRAHGGVPVTFLAIDEPGSPEEKSLRSAAHALGARVISMTPDDSDIREIVHRAAHPPAPRGAGLEKGTRWQEAGWYLLPVLVLAAALAFRGEARPRSSTALNVDNERQKTKEQATA